MANRRNFVKQIGLLAGAFSAESLFNQAHAAEFEHQNLIKKWPLRQGVSFRRRLLVYYSTKLYN